MTDLIINQAQEFGFFVSTIFLVIGKLYPTPENYNGNCISRKKAGYC